MFSDVQVDNLKFSEIVRYKDYLSADQMRSAVERVIDDVEDQLDEAHKCVTRSDDLESQVSDLEYEIEDLQREVDDSSDWEDQKNDIVCTITALVDLLEAHQVSDDGDDGVETPVLTVSSDDERRLALFKRTIQELKQYSS